MIPDIGWQELLLIAILAIIVVGPKDLPKMLRILGRWFGKARQMAMEFQRSFEELAREAELEELRQEVDSLKNMNPIDDIRKSLDPTEDLKQAGRDIEKGLENATKVEPSETAPDEPAHDAAAEEGPPEAGPAVGDFEAVADEQADRDLEEMLTPDTDDVRHGGKP